MRKASLWTAVLSCCLFVLITLSTGLAQTTLTNRKPATASSQTVSPATTVASPVQKVLPATMGTNPAIDKKFSIISAEITDLVIGTNPSGVWYWEASVKNTGKGTVNGRNLTVQGYKKSFPPAQNNWTPASGSIVGTMDIAPNQTVKVKRNWTRCCKTEQLRVQLKANNSTVLDTKTIEHMVYNPAQNTPLDVRVKRIDWDDGLKKWRATLKNFTPYTVKLTVLGYLWPAGTSNRTPVGGADFTVPGNGEIITYWFSAPTAQHGDTLKVHRRFLMGSCGENDQDCGINGSNNITLPNSTDFLP